MNEDISYPIMSPSGSAPTYLVPVREVVALEHPMIIKNIDNGLKTLGTGVPVHQLLDADDYDGCFPLYLRPVDPTCAPLLSNNTPSSNVLLKITVPRRTGRKRKRGSNEPYTLDPSATEKNEADEASGSNQSTFLRSHSRLDNPRDLLRSLKDNVGKYHIEPVGYIDQTHRYRGMTDFHYSTTHGKFMTKFREAVLPGNVESLRKFKLDPSKGVRKNDEVIPPPTFSDKTIPVNWGYHQNSTIKVVTDQITGEVTLTNQSRGPKINTFYVPHSTKAVPTGPPNLPPPDPILNSLLIELRKALSQRPIWTRRAIMNHIPKDVPGIYLLKPAIQYVGYQFRGGPWRDAIVRYGVDPRSDPSYRIYQTLFFKIVAENESADQADRKPWHDMRSEYTRRANAETLDANSHVFDGTSISLDGKIWQVCDITDPLLVRLLSTSTLRKECDIHNDGWYCNGTWAKVRAIMRTKISAIQIGRKLEDSDFNQTLAMPDEVKDKPRITAYMPDLRPKVEPGDGGSDELVRGGVAPLNGKAWRRRKIKGIKRRNQEGLQETSGTLVGPKRTSASLQSPPRQNARNQSTSTVTNATSNPDSQPNHSGPITQALALTTPSLDSSSETVMRRISDRPPTSIDNLYMMAERKECDDSFDDEDEEGNEGSESESENGGEEDEEDRYEDDEVSEASEEETILGGNW